MGYWEMGKGGASFESDTDDPADQMIWGDQPADTIDNAISEIKIAFLRDVGRMPSKSEIIEGIKFSTNVLDGLAETPKNAPMPAKEQRAVIYEFGWAATGGDERLPERRIEASKKVGEVIRALSVIKDDGPKDPINWDEITPDNCVYDGVVYPEHDYDEVECRRCGAEADVGTEEE